MTLQNIDLTHLTISPLNVRKYGAKDVADLIPSIRTLGLLQPLLVRQGDENGRSYEVVAGQRRLLACHALAEEGVTMDIPCLVLVDSDDATLIEASLAENLARLPMDEVDQYKAFAKLVKEGRSVEDIAASFGLAERMVTQRLALGRLHAPILTAYRKGDIQARDIRILTMATPKQQKAWWALMKDPDAYLPTGQQLKDWLFGGAHIPVENALFDVDASDLTVVSDLFGKDSYFADAEAFWEQQNEAIHVLVTCYEAAGWQEVIVLERGAYFATWEHRKTPMQDGGKVFITVSHQGEVTEHEGYLTNVEARRRDKADASKDEAPELTKPAQNYVDLHRHAAVQAELLGQSSLALRLIAAHMICGSDLWQVRSEPQNAAKDSIAESLELNTGQQAMQAERKAIRALLGLTEEDGYFRTNIIDIFQRLQPLTDEVVLRVLTFLMADTLSVQSLLIDMLGETLGTDMRDHWSPDTAFFHLIRDKQVLNAMVAEFAGDKAARENLTATAKTHRAILTACLDGTRAPIDPNWTPRYLAFPQGSYRATFTPKASDKEAA